MAALQANRRVVVIPVGISRYREPTDAQIKMGLRRFADLPSVETDVERLAALFRTDSYRTHGFEVRPAVSGTAGEVTDKLNEIVGDLGGDPPATVVLIWSGHGETPDGGELRLATIENCSPMQAGQGFAPAELVNKLAGARSEVFCLVLDVCQSGAAGAAVAETAAQRFRESQIGKIRRMAAVFSAQAYEEAEEGLFAGVLERVLREGPSVEARARVAEQGWGGFAHNRLLTIGELDSVMQAEFDLLKQKKPRAQSPACQSLGTFGLFPNPLFKADAPPMGVDAARRRWLAKDRDDHFLPKARGLEPSEEGWFFSGREAVSREVVDWLNRRGKASEGIYVLTGSGGTGKSAIIGRTVALSDRDFRAVIKKQAPAAIGKARTLPKIGSVDAALHLRNLDVSQAFAGLGGLLGIGAPEAVGASAWANALAAAKPARRGMTIALDALDEASEPAGIAEQLIQPLAAQGWRFLVGTRPSAALRGADQLLDRLGPAHVRDLDVEETTQQDIETYVTERLARTARSPYADHSDDTAKIAAKIAEKAKGRFLFARIAASGLLRRPRIEIDEIDQATGDSVGEALTRDLDKQEELFAARFGRRGVNSLLAALAFAQGEGLPLRDGLWALVAGAVDPDGATFTDEHTQWVLVHLGRYIIESGDGEQAVYRLFHESLNEHFRAGQLPTAVEVRIVNALLRSVDEASGWDHANPYIVRHVLAYFPTFNQKLVRICTDPSYLRRALDLLGIDRLTETLLGAGRLSGAIEAVAKSLQRARVALSRDPDQLAAQLHARLAGEESDALKRLIEELPRVAPPFWLRSRGASFGWQAALETIQTFGAKVRALAFGSIGGVNVVAVGAGDRIILWDPRAGALPRRTMENDGLRVTGLAIGSIADREVLAVAAAYDGKLIIRDAKTGAPVGEPIDAYGNFAMGLFGGRPALTARDGIDGYIVHRLDGGERERLGPFKVAAVGRIGTVLVGVERREGRHEVVDLATREAIGHPIEDPQDATLFALGQVGGEPVMCHASRSGNARLRNLRTGRELCEAFTFDFRVRTLVVGEVEGECIVVAGNDTDKEAGYVSIKQPLLLHNVLVRRRDPDVMWNRIIGVGLEKAYDKRDDRRRLVLLFEGIGAVDPLTWQIVAGAEDEQIDVVSGAWDVPAAIMEPARMSGSFRTLRPDKPLEWPVDCQAWQTIGGRLFEARGSYGGAVWVIDAQRGDVVAGPFRSFDKPIKVVRLKRKQAATPLNTPATAVSLGTWKKRPTVAVAHIGRVDVFDVGEGQHVGSPDTGDSEIVAVSLGESNGRPLLAAGSAGGVVTIWEGPAMKRLASVTIDSRVLGVWLAGDVVAVHKPDGEFHVFDLVTNP